MTGQLQHTRYVQLLFTAVQVPKVRLGEHSQRELRINHLPRQELEFGPRASYEWSSYVQRKYHLCIALDSQQEKAALSIQLFKREISSKLQEM